MKKRFWNEIDEQETLERLKIEIETQKLKKVNKIEGKKSIKDTTKRETEVVRRENRKTEKIKTAMKELRMEIKFNELASNLDIRLFKRSNKSILNIVEYVSKGKNLKTKLIDSSFKNKHTTYCLELPFRIISFSSYANIETMNTISSDVKINEFLANNPSNLFYCCLNN